MEIFYFKNSIVQRLEIISNFAKQNNNQILLKIDDSMPKVVFGDRKKFEMLFLNLMMKLLSKLHDKKINIYCRQRGTIKKMDFNIQIIISFGSNKNSSDMTILDYTIE